MRVLIQRVTQASVTIDGVERSGIGAGLVVLVGVEQADGPEDVEWLSGKICRLRVFADDQGQMNRSVLETGGGILLVSQFTLHSSTRKGNRPSFIRAATPDRARRIYEAMIARLTDDLGHAIATGEFGAKMQVALVNDGPVTIWMDSKTRE